MRRELSQRALGRPRGRTVQTSLPAFQLLVGLAFGVLVGALLIPATQDRATVEVEASGAGDSVSGLEALDGGSQGDAVSGDGSASGASRRPGSTGRGGSGQGTGSGGTDAGATGPGQTGGGAVPPGGGDGGGGPGGGAVRGVTDDEIVIGVAYPDLAAFGRVSEDFNVGDQQEQMEAILDAWRRDGLVPVHGRDIRFVYREFDILSSDEKIAACNGFIKDDKVFAVIAGRFFGEGAECVTDRFDTPLVTVNSAPEAVYQRTAPYYFTLRAPWERLFRNWMHWADVGGHLRGKTIGLFYESEVRGPVATGIKDELRSRGYEIKEEVEAEGAGIGSSQDQLAVQRFRSSDVDLVMLVTGGTSAINFMTFAESQGYRPTYIDTDYGEHTTDAAASAYEPNQYDGTFAMSATRVGEVAAGMALPPETVKCVSDYESYSGRDVGPRSPETAEYNNIVVSCDMANVMLRGLQGAGRALDGTRLVQALEGVQGMPLAAHGNLSFGPGRHYGVTEQRTVLWSQECRCWTAQSAFVPFAL